MKLIPFLPCVAILALATGCKFGSDDEATTASKGAQFICHQDNLRTCLRDHREDPGSGYESCTAVHCVGNINNGHRCDPTLLKKCVTELKGGGACVDTEHGNCHPEGIAATRESLDNNWKKTSEEAQKMVAELQKTSDNLTKEVAKAIVANELAKKELLRQLLEAVESTLHQANEALAAASDKDRKTIQKIIDSTGQSKQKITQEMDKIEKVSSPTLVCNNLGLKACAKENAGAGCTILYCKDGSKYRPGNDVKCATKLLKECLAAHKGESCVTSASQGNCK